ncbi:hypothetical protein AUJ95_09510 [Candidatus Desantisbacteria bacterium CG2_30_40_21]|uniref:Phage-Barnase-EndoU-ColicinE5/D-RelE like nuclease 2 domain-containing protein n=1 Tax=Candidatus Desantisbacteria bacterium CG2_30_40_21 TaxID=1817895 RepID=A0A1J5DJD2_9BACT|nr:MAG: hypothetical protein AUJ95_09510 [Candidatus Desantisbacteria bacterium CG2_30_40_21]
MENHLDIVYSINGIPIRLTRERWFHIIENHDDLAGYYEDVLSTIEEPDIIIPGYGGTLIAIKGMGTKHYLGVIYKEYPFKKDGFVLSAYFTSKIDRRKAIWPVKS